MVVLRRLALLFLIGVSSVFADPAADVRAAVQALREASGFAWESTTRQTTREYPDVKMPDDLQEAAPVVEVEGKTQRGGYTQVTVLPSKRGVEVPVTAYIKSTVSAVAETPLGFLTRQEMRDSPEQNKTMPVDGKPIRLSRLFGVARRATDIETPVVDLLGFLIDIGSYEESGDDVIGRLKPVAASMLAQANGARSAGDLKALVVFRLRDGVLKSFEVRLEIEIPRAGRDPIKSLTRWSTTLSGIGSTTVSPPLAAQSKLDKADRD